MHEITLEMTENTPENADKLSYGDGYLVEYMDVKINKRLQAVGIWKGPAFKFPAMTVRLEPSMAYDPFANHVTAWWRAKDWRA